MMIYVCFMFQELDLAPISIHSLTYAETKANGIGVGRFRILGGARFRILGGGMGCQNLSRHMTS